MDAKRCWLGDKLLDEFAQHEAECEACLEAYRLRTATLREASDLLFTIGRRLEDLKPRNGDWACVQCKPHSDIIKAGFQCAYHRLYDWLHEAALRDDSRLIDITTFADPHPRYIPRSEE